MKITKDIEGMFLRYFPTRALVVSAIVSLAMILSLNHSIEQPNNNPPHLAVPIGARKQWSLGFAGSLVR